MSLLPTPEISEQRSAWLPDDEPGYCLSWDDPLEPRPGLLWRAIPRSPATLALMFFLVMILIRPWEKLFPWLQPMRYERVMTLSVLAVIGLTRGYRLGTSLQTFGVFGMLGAMVIGAATALRQDLAWTGPSSAYEYTALVLIYVCILSVVRQPYELAMVVVTYAVANVLYASKSQWEFWLHGSGETMMGVLRLTGIDGTNGHPNSFATLLVVQIPAFLFLLRQLPAIGRTWRRSWYVFFRWGLRYGIALAVISTLMTNSRAGFLTLLVMGTIAVTMRGSLVGIIKLSAAMLIVGSLLWVCLPESTQNRFLSIVDRSASNDSAAESADGRIVAFQIGMEIFRRFPLTGVGPNNFIAYRVAYLDGVQLDPHNLLAEILAATGFVGLSAFSLMLLALWLNTAKMMRLAKRQPCPATQFYRDLAITMRFQLLALLIMGCFTHDLFRVEWMYLAAIGVLAVQFLKKQLVTIAAEEAAEVDESNGRWEWPLSDHVPLTR